MALCRNRGINAKLIFTADSHGTRKIRSASCAPTAPDGLQFPCPKIQSGGRTPPLLVRCDRNPGTFLDTHQCFALRASKPTFVVARCVAAVRRLCTINMVLRRGANFVRYVRQSGIPASIQQTNTMYKTRQSLYHATPRKPPRDRRVSFTEGHTIVLLARLVVTGRRKAAFVPDEKQCNLGPLLISSLHMVADASKARPTPRSPTHSLTHPLSRSLTDSPMRPFISLSTVLTTSKNSLSVGFCPSSSSCGGRRGNTLCRGGKRWQETIDGMGPVGRGRGRGGGAGTQAETTWACAGENNDRLPIFSYPRG